ncbi:uncharacterized protein LAESUDRAFT_728709 [Laetiporus sulphureus 93-53]|uniref:Uncharacterized protein n=1 Tax=Laetiporus sulphureus 93-53 TaxID=1314785 RepID=A0A165D202_9APHY|nr:uncharacterized protein LAESUDRAFT_728709 [Laetiporus sulphureus 93-53]KZT03994.1 hypothetical protein LAESUDRAFT_728709 [Laetiporus sulphureus 93-53]
MMNTIACRIKFSVEGHGIVRPVGVNLQPIRGGSVRVVTSRHEIVIACDALRNPQLLMLRYGST